MLQERQTTANLTQIQFWFCALSLELRLPHFDAERELSSEKQDMVYFKICHRETSLETI